MTGRCDRDVCALYEHADRARRSAADAGRMGQRRAGFADAVRRGAGASMRCSTADGQRRKRACARWLTFRRSSPRRCAIPSVPVPEGLVGPGRRAGAAPLRGLSQQCHRRPRQGAGDALSGASSGSSARSSSAAWRAPMCWPSRRARRCCSTMATTFADFIARLRAGGGAALSRRCRPHRAALARAYHAADAEPLTPAALAGDPRRTSSPALTLRRCTRRSAWCARAFRRRPSGR